VGKKAMIAAMAPNEVTIDTFWQMIFECNVTLIIMLCPLEENNKV
jgi:protein tyrosine phosphatase